MCEFCAPVKPLAKQIRIVYMGTPEFAVAPLRRLVEEGYHVVAVVTMPDKPAGRGLKVQQSAVKQYALSAGLPVLQPEKLKDPAFVEAFRALRADLGIVIAFRMLPEVIWAAPRLGTFNLHASLLPQYRGAAPINWAIINGETETGVTTFMLNHEIDQGDVLGQRRVSIDPADNAGTLHDKLMAVGTELVVETVENIVFRRVRPVAQPEAGSEVSLRAAPKIFKDDCRIDWTRTSAEINDLIRGLSPYPAAWTLLETSGAGGSDDQMNIRIFAAHPEPGDGAGDTSDASETGLAPGGKRRSDDPSPVPGTIITDHKTSLRIVCGEGLIRIDELQPAGKRRMSAEEWLRGFRVTSAMRFS